MAFSDFDCPYLEDPITSEFYFFLNQSSHTIFQFACFRWFCFSLFFVLFLHLNIQYLLFPNWIWTINTNLSQENVRCNVRCVINVIFPNQMVFQTFFVCNSVKWVWQLCSECYRSKNDGFCSCARDNDVILWILWHSFSLVLMKKSEKTGKYTLAAPRGVIATFSRNTCCIWKLYYQIWFQSHLYMCILLNLLFFYCLCFLPFFFFLSLSVELFFSAVDVSKFVIIVM